jgi:myo-inositol-1(or 4)-monophosphatase
MAETALQAPALRYSMKKSELQRALRTAETAARAAGALMRRNARSTKRIHSQTQHDIKLELDVRCQKLIEKRLLADFPDVAILGEEGVRGDVGAPARWVVDPIDGTVNFTYGIPHACVSIALQTRIAEREARNKGRVRPASDAPRSPFPVPRFTSVVGVVYDPFTDELWTAVRGGRARLNGRPISVSDRSKLEESIVALGFAKNRSTLNRMLPEFNRLVHRVRKIRIMGAAALSLVYVASGRMDAYVEYGLRLWDIAAGGLIVECAGGEFWHRALEAEHTFELVASNGRLRRRMERLRKASRK